MIVFFNLSPVQENSDNLIRETEFYFKSKFVAENLRKLPQQGFSQK